MNSEGGCPLLTISVPQLGIHLLVPGPAVPGAPVSDSVTVQKPESMPHWPQILQHITFSGQGSRRPGLVPGTSQANHCIWRLCRRLVRLARLDGSAAHHLGTHVLCRLPTRHEFTPRLTAEICRVWGQLAAGASPRCL